jgi:hypothetical protein
VIDAAMLAFGSMLFIGGFASLAAMRALERRARKIRR